MAPAGPQNYLHCAGDGIITKRMQITDWLSKDAIMISCMCHVQRLERHGGKEKRDICGMLILFFVCFPIEVSLRGCVCCVLRGWDPAPRSVSCTSCTSSPVQQRGKECWRGLTVHSSATLCVRSRSGRGLASRSECVLVQRPY